MLQTKVHKDITKYEARIAGGLTMHNMLSIVIGALFGIISFFIFGRNITVAMSVTFIITALGFYNFDRVMIPYLKALRLPSVYVYAKNYYISTAEMEDSINVWKKATKDSKEKKE